MQTSIALLEDQLPPLMEQAQVVGLTVALVNDERVAWSKGFGWKNAAAGQSVDVETVFEAASLSKPVFAYCVLKLCSAGLLDLDTPLTHYLADPYLPDSGHLDRLTARHVLSHTSGFPNWRPSDQLLQIHFPPGERFSYSGEGYVYLQRVVEQLTGQALAHYSQAAVLAPLEMVNSSYVWLDRYEWQAAQSYDEQGRLAEKSKNTEANAAYTLHTTAEDFARFMLRFMGPASRPRPDSFASAMLQPQIQVNRLAPWHPTWPEPSMPLMESLYWGLGWGLERGRMPDTFWHWGDNGSFKAFALGIPTAELGLVVLTTGGRARELWPAIVQLVIGDDHPALAWLKIVYEQ
jgi:CubicO group peptidase (beta-lactamase class C family)